MNTLGTLQRLKTSLVVFSRGALGRDIAQSIMMNILTEELDQDTIILLMAKAGNTSILNVLWKNIPIHKHGSILHRVLKVSIKNHHLSIIHMLINTGFQDWNIGLRYAAREGNEELVKFFIQKGANNFKDSMCYAARGNHMNLVTFFIKKGDRTWNKSIIYACKGGHIDMVKNLLYIRSLYMEKGTRRYMEKHPGKVVKVPEIPVNFWNRLMYESAKRGFKDLVMFFIGRGACDFEKSVEGACRGGHMDLVLYLIPKSLSPGVSRGLYNSARGGHMNMIELLMKKHEYVDYNMLLQGAARGGHRDLVLLFMKRCDDLDLAMKEAARGGHMDLVLFFIENGATEYYHAIKSAARKGHEDLVKYLVSKYFPRRSYWDDEMYCAVKGGNLELVKYFYDKGVENIDLGIFYATGQYKNKEIEEYLNEKKKEKERIE